MSTATPAAEPRGLVLIDAGELAQKLAISTKTLRRRLGFVKGFPPSEAWAWLLEPAVLYSLDGRERWDLAAVDREIKRRFR